MGPWPVELHGLTPVGRPILLNELRRRDRDEWRSVRERNREWLAEWEATSPVEGSPVVTFPALVRHYAKEGRAGRMLPFTIRVEGRLVGQLSVFGISWGSLMSAAAGYWMDQGVAGQGIAPTALALAGDHALGRLGCHAIW